MEYKIVTAGGSSAEKAAEMLETRVSAQMKNGWIPLGGVAMTMEEKHSTHYTLAQGLTRSGIA